MLARSKADCSMWAASSTESEVGKVGQIGGRVEATASSQASRVSSSMCREKPRVVEGVRTMVMVAGGSAAEGWAWY